MKSYSSLRKHCEWGGDAVPVAKIEGRLQMELKCYRCGEWPCTCKDGQTIVHGDCRHVMRQLQNSSVRLLWTDPPYGHSNHDGDLNDQLNKHRSIESKPIANDGNDAMRSVVDQMLIEATRVLCDDCCCCCCCCCGGGGPKPTFAWLAERMDNCGLSFFHSVIWDKRNPGLGWRFRRRHEMLMVAHKTGGRLSWPNEIAVPNIIDCYPPRNRKHPNEKPLELPKLFIDWTTETGDLVLDPFMGSGVTLRAAKDMGRRCIGIELEEKYCEIAAGRLRQEVLF